MLTESASHRGRAGRRGLRGTTGALPDRWKFDNLPRWVQVPVGILALLYLALEIWESLGDERPSGRLTPEQRETISRRDAELDANPGMALTWEQIRSSVENGQ